MSPHKFVTRLFTCFAVIAAAGAADVSAADMLADRHVAKGMTCSSCHAETPPSKAVKTEKCLECHGSLEKIGERYDAAKNGNLPNPHVNHNSELYCEDCHRGHSQGVNYCAQCHDFVYKIP